MVLGIGSARFLVACKLRRRRPGAGDNDHADDTRDADDADHTHHSDDPNDANYTDYTDYTNYTNYINSFFFNDIN